MDPIRVVIADDHPVVRSGIRSLLEQAAEIEIVGEAANGAETLHLVKETQPDVLLLDIELPDIQGTLVAQEVHQACSNVKTLILSAHNEPSYVREILKLGVAGYLVKEESPDLIVEAVRGVAHGEKGWLSRQVAAQVASWVESDQLDETELTPREQEVLRLVVQGKTNQAIAVDMKISEKTVEKYLSQIFTKMNVSSRVQAAVLAVRVGLV